jgi:hypothetical protein
LNGWSILLLGIGLGLRHATDADHVVVVSALLQREPGVWRAVRVAALWSAGHTAAFLGLGLLVVLAGVRLPVAFERVVEVLVATMLIGFGVWHLARNRARSSGDATVVASSAYARPVVIGVVHGLAGSAGIALLAATTITSRALAATYLALFGLGTILGMVALTLVISRPIGWTMRQGDRLRKVVTIFSALLSVGLGAVLLFRALQSGAP